MTAEMLSGASVIAMDPQAQAPGSLTIEDAGTRSSTARHGMARLLPVRTGSDGRLVFVVDSFYGARMAGQHPAPHGDGPRSLLSDATALPVALEDRLRVAYATGRRQELVVRRGTTSFALELLPDNGGVTALWSEQRSAEPGDAAAARAMAPLAPSVEGDPVACVVLRAERLADRRIVDFSCEYVIAAADVAAQLPAVGDRLSAVLPTGGRLPVIMTLAQSLESGRPFRPPRGVFGSFDLEARCDLRALSFGDRAVVWVRTRPHTRSVVDLREQEHISLTRREREILLLLAEGASTTEIARTLYLSTNTVRNHVRRLLSHLGASSRLEAVVLAAKMGLLELRRPDQA